MYNNNFWYVKHPDLAFLEMTILQKVLLYSSKIEDFGILSTLKNLKELCINGIKNQEGFNAFLSNITQIESLQLLYLPKLEKFPNLSQTKLKKLQIWHCKDLSIFKILLKLQVWKS